MCKHKYIPLDLFALQDAKVEALVAEHGMAGWGIYTALLLKLAQQDKTGYAYPHDPKRLANLLPKRPRPELVRSVVEDFGLFAFCEGDDGSEVFLSPRLQSHLTGISKYAEVDTQVVTSPSEVVTEVVTSLEDRQVKPKRTYSEEAREKMAKGGRSGGQRSKRIYDCGEPSEEKAKPSEEKAKPSAKPSDEKAKPSDEKAKPSAKPSDEKAKPSDEKAKPSGGTIGGKDKEEDEVEDKTLPLTPTGGMERERIELEQIEDLGLRQMVSSLLYPNSDMRDYAKAFSDLYATATAGLTEFAQLKTLSRAFASDAQELFWALMPEDEQGRKVRPSVPYVLGAIEQFRAMLDEAKASSFLRSKPAMATLTWLIKVDNFAKVAAGNYRDASPSPHGTKPPVGNYSNSMWDKVKAEQAQKEETPEMRAYRERTQAMAKEVMARINQGR